MVGDEENSATACIAGRRVEIVAAGACVLCSAGVTHARRYLVLLY